MKTILFKSTGKHFEVNETGRLNEMRATCRTFFEGGFATERETFIVHRGQLICDQLVRFSHGLEAKCAVYLYLRKSVDDNTHHCPDLFCVSSGQSDGFDVDAGKALIDLILDGGEYEYGMARKVVS